MRLEFGGHEAADEGLKSQPALGRGENGADDLASALLDREFAGGIQIARLKPREALVAHQHQELDLGLMLGLRRIETGRTVLDGEKTITRKIAAGGQFDLSQALGRETFDGVAIERGDAHDPIDKAVGSGGQAARACETRRALPPRLAPSET